MTTTPALAVLAASVSLALASIAAASATTRPQEAVGGEQATASSLQEEAARASASTPVPILMYHVIGDPPSTAPYPELFVREADFIGQLRWLARRGYHPVTLRAVWNHWHRGASLPARPIVVSFDDGYRSHVHAAFPPMRERQWPGVLNLTVRNLRVSGGLSERQVRRLITAGWELDAHSRTHPDLTSLDDRDLAREIAGSRRDLRQRFGVPVDFFCYPSGDYDARVIAAVRRAGFLAATTTLEGLATPGKPYELRRVRVSRSDGVAEVAKELERLRKSSRGS